MKTVRQTAVWAGLGLATLVSGDIIVFQDDFTTATTLAEAGMAVSAGAAGGSWTLNDSTDQVIGVGGGNARASVFTSSSWQSNDGFTLDVNFKELSGAVRHSFGLIDASFNIAGTSADSINGAPTGAYGIGFTTAGEMTADFSAGVSGIGAGDALVFNGGVGVTGDKNGSVKLSIDQGNILTGVFETMSITVTPTGWSYSLNGAPATSGAFTFDTSRSYRFVAYSQSANKAAFDSITLTALTAIPEPASGGLLGLGTVLALFLRRRRIR